MLPISNPMGNHMAIQNLTSRFLDSIKPPKEGRVEYWDTKIPGFGLRVSAPSSRYREGRRAWVLMYRMDGVQRRWTFGTYPIVPLSRARERASDGLRMVYEGRDPSLEKQEARQAPTVRQLVDAYIERHAKREKNSWKLDQSMLEREIVPRFGNKKAGGIKDTDFHPVFEEVANRAPIAANRLLEVTRKTWNWAIEKKFHPSITANPCKGTKKKAENVGDRWLDPAEIGDVWRASECLPPKWRAFTRLCILTGQHPGEILRIRRSHVRGVAGGGAWWVMPSGLHKSGAAHSVYLPPLAKQELETACEESRHPDLVFPDRRNNEPNPAGLPWARHVEVIVKASGVKRFTARDFRPTLASNLSGEQLAVPEVTIAKILNHANKAITDRYIRHNHDGVKRRTMERWEEFVLATLKSTTDGNAESAVVPMPASA